jgi:hypothetical protein
MFLVLVGLFGIVATFAAGAAAVVPHVATMPAGVEATFSGLLSLWFSEWWAKFKRIRAWRRTARRAASTATVPTSASSSDDEEQLPTEIQELVKDISTLLKVSVAATSVVAALVIVRVLSVLVKRKVVAKETVDRGLDRVFKLVEWTADLGFIALFFWGNGKEEFAALQRIMSLLRKMCFQRSTFNVDLPDAMLNRVGLGSYAGLWPRLRRNKWRVAAVLVAILALSVVTVRAWKKVSKKGGLRRFFGDLLGVSSSEESEKTQVEPSDPVDKTVQPVSETEKKKKVKRKGAYMGSGDGDGNRGRKVSDDGTYAVDPERVHALPPFHPDSSGEIPLYNKDGSDRAMAGAVSHDGSPLVVSIAHAVRDGGAYWDTAGKQPVVVVRYFNEDKDDAIAVLKPPATLPRAAKTIGMNAAHASALIWKSGTVSSGSVFQADEGKLRHTCGTLPGHSGSLVFAYVDGRWAAVGVHCGSSSTHNIAYSFF